MGRSRGVTWRALRASLRCRVVQIHAKLLERKSHGHLCNAIMASAPGHPFWMTLMRSVQRYGLRPAAQTFAVAADVCLSPGPPEPPPAAVLNPRGEHPPPPRSRQTPQVGGFLTIDPPPCGRRFQRFHLHLRFAHLNYPPPPLPLIVVVRSPC